MTEQIEGYRISPQQAHIFLRQRALPEPLIAQCVIRLDGVVDLDTLQQSIAQVVSRHAMLRTRFVGQVAIELPVQVISDQARFEWRVIDPAVLISTTLAADALAVDDLKQWGRALLEQEGARSFALADGPMLHVAALPLTDHLCLLSLCLPALCSDTLTLHNLVREIGLAYGDRRAYEVGSAETVQYLQFSEWQNEVLADEDAAIGKEYWQKEEVGGAHDLMLPFAMPGRESDVARTQSLKPLGSGRRGRVSVALNAGVAELAQQLESSEEIVLLSCWQVLVWRLNGNSAVTTTQVQDGRKYEELAATLGLFAQALPLRGDCREGMTLAALVKDIGARVAEGNQWQEYFAPVESADGSGYAGGIGYEYERRPEALEAGGLRFEIVEQEAEGEGEAVKLKCVRSGDELWATVEYEGTIYQSGWMEVLAGQMQELVESAVAQGGQGRIEGLNMLSQSQRQLLLIEWNRTNEEYASEKSVHQLIEEQVERTPDAVALSFEGQELSYAELNGRANQLAHHLESLGVGPDQQVGVMMERSLELVISLLAILKAGGAYVPFDPSYPAERLSFMLEDAAVNVLLTQVGLLERLPEAGGANGTVQVVAVDGLKERLDEEASTNPRVRLSGANLAYMIYTSGSTGTPKGAMNTHEAIVNRLLWMQQRYQLGAADVVLQKTPLSFDVSVWEFFWPLLAGARLVVARPEGHRDPNYLVAVINEEQVTTLHFVPAMLQAFLSNETVSGGCGSVRRVICSGEALSVELAEQCLASLPQAELHNLYGPTEAAVDVTAWHCQPGEQRASVPIGRPIANTEIYILDRELQAVPVGVSGDLYIGGAGLARGYHRRAELTAERFLPHPLSRRPGERLYRTGDVARYGADGAIEYLGRDDHQVKIRGYRIELGEIEAVLRQHPQVSDVVVLAREDVVGDKRIVAYLVSPAVEDFSPGDIRRFLHDKLPDYMIPASFVPLTSLPSMPNGKVNREALPAPGLGRAGMEEAYVAPRTVLEEAVARIWAETIGIERLGVYDNFFELGGHSLLATQVISRVREDFEVELPVRIMFEEMTVEKMVAGILSREVEPGQSEKIARTMKAVEEMTEGEFAQILESKRALNENQRPT